MISFQICNFCHVGVTLLWSSFVTQFEKKSSTLSFFLPKSGHSASNHAKYNYYYALQNQNQIQFPFFCQISSNYRYRWWLKSLIEKRKRLRNPVSTEVVLSYNFFLVKAETSPEECLLSMAFLFFELDRNLGFLVRVFLLGQNVCVFVFTILCLHIIHILEYIFFVMITVCIL